MNGDSYKLTGNFSYSYYPNKFFGMGNNTQKENEENYTSRLFRINPVFQKNVMPNLFIGVQYDYMYGKILKSEPSGLLQTGHITGANGGSTSGFGINLTWDSRNNNLYPLNGSLHQVVISSFGRTLGSDFIFTCYLVDLRHYFQISDQHVLAVRAVGCFNDGHPSFLYLDQISSLGQYLRGYNQTRFVDNNLIAFQTEYRMPFFWRFGLAAFGISMGIIGLIYLTWMDFGLMFLLGLGNGYITIMLFTWIQTHTPKTMMGRIMSLLMLSSAGLVPISQTISGVIISWNLVMLFIVAGGLIVLVTYWTALQPALVTFSESLSERNIT
jgi:hypothetical protein